jgi:hypothetical protein
MYFFNYLVVCFALLFSTGCANQQPESCQKILKYAQENMPACGVLKMNHKGFVCVDVDDDYIHDLILFIEQEGFVEPPYFDGDGLYGAHISVMYESEVKKYGIKEVEEVGEIIPFTLKGCQIVHPRGWKQMDKVYVIVVDAPELAKIRKKYGLPESKHPFHITIGVKQKIAQAA